MMRLTMTATLQNLRFVVWAHNRMRLLKTTLALFVLAVVGSASAADNFQSLRAGLPHDALYAMARADDALWAVGGHGMVLRSPDNGKSWERLASPGDFAALDVTTGDSQPVLVGQAGKAFEAVGGGNGWKALETGTDQRLLSVTDLAGGGQMAVGAFGTIIMRNPNSDSFEPITVDWEALVEDGFEPHLYDVLQTKSGTILISGEFGMVLRSRDNGKSWSVHNNDDASVFALHEASNGLLMGVGQAGYIISSGDDGESWQSSASGTEANLLGVSSSGNTFAAVGVRAVLSSKNGGKSWKALVNRDTERRWYQGVTPISGAGEDRKFIAAGQFGQIINF